MICLASFRLAFSPTNLQFWAVSCAGLLINEAAGP